MFNIQLDLHYNRENETKRESKTRNYEVTHEKDKKPQCNEPLNVKINLEPD